MKKIIDNIELIIVLFITFLIFTSLVLFYEGKLKETKYYNNSNKTLTVNFKYLSKVNNNIIELDGDYTNYVELDKEIVDVLVIGNDYKVVFKTNNKKVEEGNLTKLFQTYEVIRVEG